MCGGRGSVEQAMTQTCCTLFFPRILKWALLPILSMSFAT